MHPNAVVNAADESLIKEPYLDSLIKANLDGLQNARARRKIKRINNVVKKYLDKKFPYAEPNLIAIPLKEFPGIAKMAKNYFLVRIAGASLWALASTGGIFEGFAYMILAWPQESAVGLFFGGFGIAALAAASLVFAIRKTNSLAELLFGKYYYYDSWR